MKALVIFTLLLFSFVLLKNAWLCDDFWISLRQIEQLFAGNGLRWNPHERIQLFTSVIGFSLTVIGRVFTDDYFINYATQAIVFNALLLVLLAKLLRSPAKWCAAVLLLLASNTFMDFTWSGLHNFIGHVMLLSYLLLWKELSMSKNKSSCSRKTVLLLAALVGLAPLFRHDFAILVWPPAAIAFWQFHRNLQHDVKVSAILLALLPIGIWTSFSLIYFGFPFPLTAYIKLGGDIPRINWLINGMQYYLHTIDTDLPAFIIMLFALLGLVFRGGHSGRALAVGMLLHLSYTAFTGVDYMGGRFFTYVYLLSVIALVTNCTIIMPSQPHDDTIGGNPGTSKIGRHSWRPQISFWAIAGALVWMLAFDHTPLKSPFYYGKPDQPKQTPGGIADERSAYHYASNILSYISYKRGITDIFPNHSWVRLGKLASRSTAPVLHLCNIGMTAFHMRLEQKIIDVYGFSDVFQSRLPGLTTRPAHLVRRLPKGYLKSVAENDALIENKQLNEYYAKLRIVSQSPTLFSYERIASIIAVNTQSAPTVRITLGPILPRPMLCGAPYRPELFKRLEQDIENISAETLNESVLSS